LHREASEELDRRRFHNFIKPEEFMALPARFDGSWMRAGRRLNDTLDDALQRALARTGSVGTRTGRLKPEVQEALEKDLESLRMGLEEDRAAVFWNFEDIRLSPMGPMQTEMLGRFVRWAEGFLGMPVERVEVSRFVEPWERLGAFGHDWLFHMQNLGMVVHRVWPPRAEMTNMVLTRSIGALAKIAAARRRELDASTEGEEDEDEEDEEEDAEDTGLASPIKRAPRLICVLSEDLFFDDSLRMAQRAGQSAIWIGPNQRGVYYPANSDVIVRIDLLKFDTLMEEVAMSVRNPFTPGVTTIDAPLPALNKTSVPVDVGWGRPSDLQLDRTTIRIPKEVLRSRVGIGM